MTKEALSFFSKAIFISGLQSSHKAFGSIVKVTEDVTDMNTNSLDLLSL